MAIQNGRKDGEKQSGTGRDRVGQVGLYEWCRKHIWLEKTNVGYKEVGKYSNEVVLRQGGWGSEWSKAFCSEWFCFDTGYTIILYIKLCRMYLPRQCVIMKCGVNCTYVSSPSCLFSPGHQQEVVPPGRPSPAGKFRDETKSQSDSGRPDQPEATQNFAGTF